jgi:beta-N-acetylhexosaminidase
MNSYRTRHSRFSRRALLGATLGMAAGGRLDCSRTHAARKSSNAVDRVLEQMTIEEKIGQMFVIQAADLAISPWFSDALASIQPGGVLFVEPNIGTPDQISTYIEQIHASGRYVPPFVAVDQEGGPVARVPGDPVPGASSLAMLPDAHVQKLARDRARFLGSFGFNVNFAPVADVAYSPMSSMADRSFGNNPKAVAQKITAVVDGSRDGRIASSAKHFPGHGRTIVDSHVGLPTIDITTDEWLATDAVPFIAAIGSGVEMIMFGHLVYSQWDAGPASLSAVAEQHLRQNLGFEGVTVTDDLGMGALSAVSPFDLVDRAVDSGIDLMLYTSANVSFAELIAHTRGRVDQGAVSIDRIDASVRRILLMKTEWFEFPDLS